MEIRSLRLELIEAQTLISELRAAVGGKVIELQHDERGSIFS
jgi:hypothetical protein